MTLKVKEVTDIVEKSVQEVENELLQKHEEKQALQDANAESRVLEKESTITKEVVGEQEIKKELQEKEVLDYLGNRYGKEINSFDDLVTEREIKEELPEDVAAYLKYKKETGRGVEDYVKLNQDFDGMNPDVLLSEYFLATDEAIDPEDVESLMEDFIYDEDVDDESDIKKKKLAKKRIVRKATKYFNDQKDTFKQPLESRAVDMSDDDKSQLVEYKQYVNDAATQKESNERKRDWFSKKSDEVFSSEFKGFEFNLGENNITYKPADVETLKKSQSNIMNFVDKYLDKDGMMTNVGEYHKALSLAMNPEKFAQFFYEQGKSVAIEGDARKTKNINMGLRNAPEVSTSKGGMKIRTVNSDSGNSLRIRSSKRK
tara:strand:- start:3771 stop:4886 length:1116 start_codon:yes stop_codon:yes gene_type:complete